MSPSHPSSRRAFTLLELIVVLSIAAVLASIVMLSLGSHFQQAAMARAVDGLVTADRIARRTAAEHTTSRVSLEFDLPRQLVKLSAAGAPRTARTFTWPSKVRLAEPQLLHSRGWTSTNGSIEFSPNGSSPTYSVRLTAGKVSQWLVVFGITGQATVYETPEQFLDLIQELSP